MPPILNDASHVRYSSGWKPSLLGSKLLGHGYILLLQYFIVESLSWCPFRSYPGSQVTLVTHYAAYLADEYTGNRSQVDSAGTDSFRFNLRLHGTTWYMLLYGDMRYVVLLCYATCVNLSI